MPLCGFNTKMINGLKAFNEGLVEYGIVHRGEQNKETTEQGIRREISDMTRLLPELGKISSTGKRIITEGMVRYAMGFYILLRETQINGRDRKQLIDALSTYFETMDATYYGSLEGTADDMKQLIQHLENIDI